MRARRRLSDERWVRVREVAKERRAAHHDSGGRRRASDVDELREPSSANPVRARAGDANPPWTVVARARATGSEAARARDHPPVSVLCLVRFGPGGAWRDRSDSAIDRLGLYRPTQAREDERGDLRGSSIAGRAIRGLRR